MTEEAPILVERDGSVAIWTIDRAERMNALSRATVRQFGELARAAATDDSIRAIVITGAGERAFCAGADLKERKGMDEEDVRDFLALYRAAFDAIDRCPKPVICAINGFAFGGGVEVALACDLRVASSTAKIGLTEVSLAIIPGAGGTQRVTRLVGPAIAKELILFSKRLSADEALELGLVNEVAEDAKSRAIEMAKHFETAAPIAVSAALDAIDAACDLSLDAGLLHERRCYERTLSSTDRLEALAAFREKRPPVYKGE